MLGSATPTPPDDLWPAPSAIAAPAARRRPNIDRAAGVTPPGLTDQPSRHRPTGRGPRYARASTEPTSTPTTTTTHHHPPPPLTQALVQICDSEPRTAPRRPSRYPDRRGGD